MINYLIEANLWLELPLGLVLLDLQCVVSCLPLDSILRSVVDIIDIDMYNTIIIIRRARLHRTALYFHRSSFSMYNNISHHNLQRNHYILQPQ